MAKRGFLAELNHQAKQAEKRNQQARRAAAKAHAAAAREAERARKEAERAQAAALRADVQAQRAAEKEAKVAHVTMQTRMAESMTAQLESTYDEVDSILAATLDVDDYVDLASLRQTAEHEPFPRPDLLQATMPPPARPTPEEPMYVPPEPPRGVGALVGAKKRFAKATEQAQNEFAEAQHAWQLQIAANKRLAVEDGDQYRTAEARRLTGLASVQNAYDSDCASHDAEVAAANAELDRLIAELAIGTERAVNEYIGIVLSNSIYPTCFEVETAFTFDAELAELNLTAWVPGPDSLPTEKAFKYIKAKDEITSALLSAKAQKDRYSGAIHAVALRSLHEVFEADRQGVIQTISLTVATSATNPATGRNESVAFIAAAAERDSFLAIDLANVVPIATLQHLGAQVSKDPFGLVGIDMSQGVRSL